MKVKVIYPFTPTWLDYPDNESQAIVIHFLGCEHNCNECHNPLFQQFDNDKAIEVSTKNLYDFLHRVCYENKTNKIVFEGGDSLHPLNRSFTRQFLNKYSNVFDICIYTGYSFLEFSKMELKGFKYIKCGNFQKDLFQQPIKTDSYIQLASTNQEIYDTNFNLLTRNGRMYFK